MMSWFTKEREQILRSEARSKIRIEDYGDEICITIDGIKARTVKDVDESIAELRELREAYVAKRLH